MAGATPVSPTPLMEAADVRLSLSFFIYRFVQMMV